MLYTGSFSILSDAQPAMNPLITIQLGWNQPQEDRANKKCRHVSGVIGELLIKALAQIINRSPHQSIVNRCDDD